MLSFPLYIFRFGNIQKNNKFDVHEWINFVLEQKPLWLIKNNILKI